MPSPFILAAGNFREESTGESVSGQLGGFVALARRSIEFRRSSSIALERARSAPLEMDAMGIEIANEIEKEGRASRGSQDAVRRMSQDVARVSMEARRKRSSAEMRRAKALATNTEEEEEPLGAAVFEANPKPQILTPEP